jgi:hypothetical protein
MDETYVKVGDQWKYLYRAVDKEGNTVDFLLTAKRDRAAAQRFLARAIEGNGLPQTVTIDQSGANTAGIESYNAGHDTAIAIRQCKYLNNIVEQDHRAVKRIIRPMLGFKSFRCARVIRGGIEIMHMIRKEQMRSSNGSSPVCPLRNNSIRWQRNSGKEASANAHAAYFFTDTVTRQNRLSCLQPDSDTQHLGEGHMTTGSVSPKPAKRPRKPRQEASETQLSNRDTARGPAKHVMNPCQITKNSRFPVFPRPVKAAFGCRNARSYGESRMKGFRHHVEAALQRRMSYDFRSRKRPCPSRKEARV